jgi:hypothetical protein
MKHTAPSGAEVDIYIADYSSSFDLMKAVMRSVRQGGVGSKIPNSLSTLASFSNTDIKELGGLADGIIDIITSKEVEESLYKCMAKCLYSDERITKDTFEKEERRGDFFYVAFQVMAANLRPFMSHLSSGLKDMFQKGTSELQTSK